MNLKNVTNSKPVELGDVSHHLPKGFDTSHVVQDCDFFHQQYGLFMTNPSIPFDPIYPYAPCMEYLPTFIIGLSHM